MTSPLGCARCYGGHMTPSLGYARCYGDHMAPPLGYTCCYGGHMMPRCYGGHMTLPLGYDARLHGKFLRFILFPLRIAARLFIRRPHALTRIAGQRFAVGFKLFARKHVIGALGLPLERKLRQTLSINLVVRTLALKLRFSCWVRCVRGNLPGLSLSSWVAWVVCYL